MSETWTEYGVSLGTGDDAWVAEMDTRAQAERSARNHGGTVVGRTVTASDWLPVDTDGAK
jgi:hypothetical protein